VEHWSARKWFTRILLTWGLCSMGLALVRTPWQFYLARFLLGVAEAGLFPGVIVYFTHWFPRADRARAMAGLVFGIPISLALGARVSGMLLEVHWLGLAGWKWVFLVEGFPAVILGFVVLWFLADRPRDARWLTPEERRRLEQSLEEERRLVAAAGGVTLSRALRQPTVWLLALGILATNTGGYALLFWLPTAVKSLLTATAQQAALPSSTASTVALLGSPLGQGPFLAVSSLVAREPSPTTVLNWMAPFYLCGLVGVWLVGQSSDRTGEYKWHCIIGQVFTGVFLAASVAPNQSWPWVFTWLCLTGFFAYFWPPPFWVLPTLTLSASAAAVAIGFINICANLAGLIGSAAVGMMKSDGYSDRLCLFWLAGWYVLGGLFIALLRVSPKVRPNFHQEPSCGAETPS
ncbi:MAG: MFS transporter, partial [Planctomycetes bacterium]|nr:MFS transporter [Planctomycetota bacterium]